VRGNHPLKTPIVPVLDLFDTNAREADVPAPSLVGQELKLERGWWFQFRVPCLLCSAAWLDCANRLRRQMPRLPLGTINGDMQSPMKNVPPGKSEVITPRRRKQLG